MLNAYSITTQSLATGDNVVFDVNKIMTGITATHYPSSSAINLNRPGFYMIEFHATAEASGAGTDPVTISLFNDGVAVPAASASEVSTAVGDTVSLSFSTLVQVLPSCAVIDNTATLTFQNTGVPATITVANVNVTKVA